MEVLVCLAKADGRVDDHERHDLTESAIALAYSMDLPHRVVRARMDDVFARFGPLDAEQRLGGFRDACQWLARNESAHFARAVFQLCLDMVHADGVVTPEEERYVEAANAILGATPRN
jgi:tellurite resistance protein